MTWRKREDGELMVEAVIVFVIAVMVVFMLMNIALFTYQKIHISATANQAAADIANIYSETEADPFRSCINTSQLYFRKPYRYIGKAGSTGLDQEQKKKAEWYAEYLMSKNDILVKPSHSNDSNKNCITVQINKNTELGQRQLVLEIKRTYPLLAVNPLKYFGLDLEYTYSATGYAQCYDMIDYINTANMTQEAASRFHSIVNGTVIGGLMENFSSLILELKDHGEE